MVCSRVTHLCGLLFLVLWWKETLCFLDTTGDMARSAYSNKKRSNKNMKPVAGVKQMVGSQPSGNETQPNRDDLKLITNLPQKRLFENKTTVSKMAGQCVQISISSVGISAYDSWYEKYIFGTYRFESFDANGDAIYTANIRNRDLFLLKYREEDWIVSDYLNTTEYICRGCLYNMRCSTVSSPTMCPNSWKYIDHNDKHKVDPELKVECEYQCGNNISSECQSEFDTAKNNGNFGGFYNRCATEQESTPLSSRCSLCCGSQENGTEQHKDCTCKSFVDIDGYGDCKMEYNNHFGCYVKEPSTCTDREAYNGLQYSLAEACRNRVVLTTTSVFPDLPTGLDSTTHDDTMSTAEQITNNDVLTTTSVSPDLSTRLDSTTYDDTMSTAEQITNNEGCCSKLIVESGTMGAISGTLVNDTVYEFPLNKPIKQVLGFPTLFLFSNDNGSRWDAGSTPGNLFDVILYNANCNKACPNECPLQWKSDNPQMQGLAQTITSVKCETNEETTETGTNEEPTETVHEGHHDEDADLPIYIALGVVSLILVTTLTCVFVLKWRKRRATEAREKSDRESDLNSSERVKYVSGHDDVFMSDMSSPNQEEGPRDRINSSKDIKSQAKLLPYDLKREIPRGSFTVKEEIGSGNFGCVSKGELKGLYAPNSITAVAIKSINGPAEGNDLKEFLHEIKIMSYVKPHLNLVSMIGSSACEIDGVKEMWLILEFCRHGDLKSFLIKNKKKILNKNEKDSINDRCLISWAYDVAKGMEYLSSNKIMHGDLAARNVLLDDNPLGNGFSVAKVADFGLSKKFYDNREYEKESRVYVPWKWMALEYLSSGFFTLNSDVWSFGVVLWEILSCGRIPYGHDDYQEVLNKLEEGYRLPCPPDIRNITTWEPAKFYEEVSKICFEAEPDNRATFTDVVRIVEKEMSKEEISEYEQTNEQYQSTYVKNYLKLGQRKDSECA